MLRGTFLSGLFAVGVLIAPMAHLGAVASAATPAPTVAADVAAPIPLAGNGCYWKNCTQAHQNGEGNIPQGSDHYCSKQDRDGDGLACEYYN